LLARFHECKLTQSEFATQRDTMLAATMPVDLRGSFNRLYGLVVEQLKDDRLSGHLFVFTNGRRNQTKVLCWDGSGL